MFVEGASFNLNAKRKVRKEIIIAIGNIDRNVPIELLEIFSSKTMNASILPKRKPILAIIPSFPNFFSRSSV